MAGFCGEKRKGCGECEHLRWSDDQGRQCCFAKEDWEEHVHDAQKFLGCKKFYFSYGNSITQPFQGGWTLVLAENKEQAIRKFNNVHEPKSNGLTNCAFVYSQKEFQQTCMYIENNNIGHASRELIGCGGYHQVFEFDC